MSRGILVDNSVWQRLGLADVKAALDDLTGAGCEIVTCAPQLLEFLWSARSGGDYAKLLNVIGACREAEPQAGFGTECVRVQQLLWNSGRVRAVGNADVEISVIAVQNDCTVIHYDSDFEHISAVEPRFSHRWIVPRGTLPH
ncbi:hypothetical protein SAMN04489806_2205 [Paramicrobacterium humi]|uniref:Ribonuclease VapC n=1 Tax=Paramicrobacterium humi TaxID=640635 RepID=A0A1H4NI60_9MICO|nr:hypothetical protein [Microbacterium humi]SEB94901.1 hypothetical protein SAMN04489806_2205 [Microbacterium humi]